MRSTAVGGLALLLALAVSNVSAFVLERSSQRICANNEILSPVTHEMLNNFIDLSVASKLSSDEMSQLKANSSIAPCSDFMPCEQFTIKTNVYVIRAVTEIYE